MGFVPDDRFASSLRTFFAPWKLRDNGVMRITVNLVSDGVTFLQRPWRAAYANLGWYGTRRDTCRVEETWPVAPVVVAFC